MKLLGHLLLLAAGLAAQPRYPYVLSTIAGDVPNGDGGPASQAFLNRPVSVAADASGNLVIAEAYGIRRVSSSNIISAVRGTETWTGIRGMTVDRDGNILAIENSGTRVRMVSPAGALTTFGGGAGGFAGDGGPSSGAQFRDARDVAACTFRGDESIYVADTGNHRIRILLANKRAVQTVLGNGTAAFAGDNGPISEVRLNGPTAVACNASGDSIYIADNGNRRIRRVKDVRVTTIAGNGSTGNPVIGPATQSPLPADVASLWVGPDQSVYFTATSSRAIYRILPDGNIRLLAGRGFGFAGDGGPATNALFESVTYITGDKTGNIYMTDRDIDRVRKVDTAGVITTFAGRDRYLGDGGPASKAVIHWTRGMTMDAQGNLIFADERSHAVRKIAPNGTITTIAGTGVRGFSGDGGPATGAQIHTPTDVKVGPDGSIYVMDRGNLRVRRIATDGVIRTIAGGTPGASLEDGPALQAQFSTPENVAVDTQGNVYVSDAATQTVRRMGADGRLNRVAGTGTQGYSGDGGLATNAQLCSPGPLQPLRDGSLLIGDRCNARIRRLSPNGIISTFAGDGTGGLGATGSVAATTAIGTPNSLAIDRAGNVYFVRANTWVAMIDPAGGLHRIAGGRSPASGDGGLALNGGFSIALGITVDAAGDVYVGDIIANNIRKLTVNSPARLDTTGGNGQSTAASTSFPQALRVRVMGRGALPVAGVPVAFAVADGAATLSARSVNTGNDGVAGIGVTAGAAPGNVVITATAEGLPPVRFALTIAGDGVTVAPPPLISEVVSGGAGGALVAALGTAAVKGQGFAPAGTARQVQPADLVDGRYPRILEGVCVEFAGVRAPILSLEPERILLQTPDLPSGEAPVRVIAQCDQAGALLSEIAIARVAAAAPELLTVRGGPHVAAVNQNGAAVGPAELGEGFVVARPGDTITISGTGFGATDPPLALGESAASPAPTVERPRVTIGETELAETGIVSCAAMGPPGSYQLVIRIPNEAAPGAQEVVVRLGAIASPAGALLAIGPAQ